MGRDLLLAGAAAAAVIFASLAAAPVGAQKFPEFPDARLNHRPRKCLGWRTPYEVFFNLKPVAL